MRSKQILLMAFASTALAAILHVSGCSNSDPASNPEPTLDGTLPRVVGAASTGNTSVVVIFNKSMGDSASDRAARTRS